MRKANIDDLRNVLTQSNSIWNLQAALRRAIELIDEKDQEIDNLIEAEELREIEAEDLREIEA